MMAQRTAKAVFLPQVTGLHKPFSKSITNTSAVSSVDGVVDAQLCKQRNFV